MDVVKEIRRAFHDFMDGRITRAELEKRLRELEERQESFPFKEAA
jgi:uncharacterized membrane protein YjjP (DUF1212 family)